MAQKYIHHQPLSFLLLFGSTSIASDNPRLKETLNIQESVCWLCSLFCRLLPATHREVRDGIEVRAQHFSVLEELISKGVKPVQRDEQVSGSHPFLEEKQDRDEETGPTG